MFLLLIGCFRGLFSEQPRYQATEYVVNSPRIVAVRQAPTNFVAEQPMTIDALLLTPKGASVGTWKASVCGLGRDVQTVIWTISCFENTEEITTLATSEQLPLSFGAPTFPELEGCDRTEESEETEETEGIEEDTGYYEDQCYHYLPLLIETTVDGTPVYAATFNEWFPLEPDFHSVPMQERPMGFHVPQTAAAGEEIPLQIEIHDDVRFGIFNWYVDAGTLLDTGITSASEFTFATSAHPNGITKSNNRLIIPDDYSGPLRVWIVLQTYEHSDMAWLEATVEVE